MKTHTARWQKVKHGTWHLKARIQDGGAVLGRIESDDLRTYTWTAGAAHGTTTGFYAAQRQVRKALKNGI